MSPNKKVWVSKGCPVHAAGKVKSAESGEAVSFRCDGQHITRSVPSSFFLARPCGSRARYSDSSLPRTFIPACPKGNQNGRKMENHLRWIWKQPGSLKEAMAVRKVAVGSSAGPLSTAVSLLSRERNQKMMKSMNEGRALCGVTGWEGRKLHFNRMQRPLF